MENTNHIAELIKRWPTRRAFADEIGANLDAVHKWAQSGRIPSDWQLAAQKAASDRGFAEITPEWMLSVHAASPLMKAGAQA